MRISFQPFLICQANIAMQFCLNGAAYSLQFADGQSHSTSRLTEQGDLVPEQKPF